MIDEKLNEDLISEDSIYDGAISELAELTAAAMELYYKLGEMLIINIESQRVTVKAENISL